MRYYAAKALAEIADEHPDDAVDAVANLEQSLSGDDDKTLYYVVKALSKIGAGAYEALPELEKLTSHAEEKISRAAEAAIMRIKKKYSESKG